MPPRVRRLSGVLVGRELQDVLDFPTPWTVRVKGPTPWIDPTHPYYGARTGLGLSADQRAYNTLAMQNAVDDSHLGAGPVRLPGWIEINNDINLTSTLELPLYMEGPAEYKTGLRFIGNYGLRVLKGVNLHLSNFAIRGDTGGYDGGGGTGFQHTAALRCYGSPPLPHTGPVYIDLFGMSFGDAFLVGCQFDDTYQVDVDKCKFISGIAIRTSQLVTDPTSQYRITRNIFNADNGICGIDMNTGGETIIGWNQFQNYKSDGTVVVAAIGAIRLTNVGTVTLIQNSYESNNADKLSIYNANVTLDNCGSIEMFNENMVSQDATGKSAKHDFIRVQNGCIKLVINGGKLNGAYKAARRVWFVRWVSGSGQVEFQSPPHQTQVIASYGSIPLLTVDAGASPSVSIEATPARLVTNGTVGNTVTETEIYSHTILANQLFVQRQLETRLKGYFSALIGDQATIRFKVAGSTICTVTTPTAAAYTNEPIDLLFTATVRAMAMQQEVRQTVVGTITSAGTNTATLVVTAAGLAGSPLTITFNVDNGDTASVVGGKARTALGMNAAIRAFFQSIDLGGGNYTVAGTTTEMNLMTLAGAANDAINIAIANGTCTGLTDDATSDDVVAGAAGSIYGHGECKAANVQRDVANTAATAVDTSQACNVTVTVQWSLANAGNTMTISQGVTDG